MNTFYKGEGCGNTFLIFDCLDVTSDDVNQRVIEAYPHLVESGRDDALILKTEFQDNKKVIIKMIVLEPDQSIAEFCGNGARVVACYLKHRFGNDKRKYYLQTSLRRCHLWWKGEEFFVNMGKTSLVSSKNRFFTPHLQMLSLGMGAKVYTFYWTQTMEPHLVTFDSISEEELAQLGAYVNRFQRDCFPCGMNLNAVRIEQENTMHVLTYERGVNRITAACGTGATSSTSIAIATNRISGHKPIVVYTKGGHMKFHFKKNSVMIMSGGAIIEH